MCDVTGAAGSFVGVTKMRCAGAGMAMWGVEEGEKERAR